jgi:hypothetical protein
MKMILGYYYFTLPGRAATLSSISVDARKLIQLSWLNMASPE